MAPSPENDNTPKAPDKNEKTKQGNPDSNKEKNKDMKTLNNLNDCELKDLLDEAITYKNPKDREGKSSLFKELLSQAEESERNARAASAGGSEQVRYCNTSAKRSKHRRKPNSISENVMHGGSLDNLAKEELFQVSHHLNRPKRTVSARQREGGSLPSNVNAGSLASAYVVPHFLVEARTKRGAGGGDLIVAGRPPGGAVPDVEPMDVDMETVSLLDHDSIAENYEEGGVGGGVDDDGDVLHNLQGAVSATSANDANVEGAGAQQQQHQQHHQQQQSVPKFTTKATLQVNVDDGLHFNELESVDKKPYEIDQITAKVVQSKYSVYIQNYSPLNEATKKVDENGNALHQNTTSKSKKKKIQSDKNVVSCVAAEKVEGHRSDIIHDVKKLLEFIGEKPNSSSHHHHHHHHQGGSSDKKGGATGGRSNRQQLQKHSSEEGASVVAPSCAVNSNNAQKTNSKKQQQMGQSQSTKGGAAAVSATSQKSGVNVARAETTKQTSSRSSGELLKKSNSLGEISTSKMGFGDEEEEDGGDEDEEEEDDEDEEREVVMRRKREESGRTDGKRERRSWGNAEHQSFHNIYKNPSLDNIESSADFRVVTKKKKTKKRRNSLSGSRRGETSTNNSPPSSTPPSSRPHHSHHHHHHHQQSSGGGGGVVPQNANVVVNSDAASRKSAFSVPHSEKSNDDSSDDSADSVRSLPIYGGGNSAPASSKKHHNRGEEAAATPASYAQIARCAERASSKKPSPTSRETAQQGGEGHAPSTTPTDKTTAAPPDVRNVKCFPAIQQSAAAAGTVEVSHNNNISNTISNNNNMNDNSGNNNDNIVDNVGGVSGSGKSDKKTSGGGGKSPQNQLQQQQQQQQIVKQQPQQFQEKQSQTLGDIQSDLSIIQANEMETIRYNAHIVPTIQMTDVTTIEKINFMNHHRQNHQQPPPHHHAPPIVQQQLNHPIPHHHHQSLPLVPIVATPTAPPDLYHHRHQGEVKSGVAYAIVATHVPPPVHQTTGGGVAYGRSAYEGAGVAYSKGNNDGRGFHHQHHHHGGGRNVMVKTRRGGETSAASSEEDSRGGRRHRHRSGEEEACSRPPPVVILSDPKGASAVGEEGYDGRRDGESDASSSVPGLVFGFDVNEQLLSEDICENFIRKYVAPECYTATSHNHEKIVNFVGLAWEEVRKSQSTGKARYYTDDL